MTVYKSKIGYELLIPLVLLQCISFVLCLGSNYWPGIIMNLLISAFCGYCYLTTSYGITETVIIIKAGLFFNRRIELADIRCVSKSRNLLSFPSLSTCICSGITKGTHSVILHLDFCNDLI